jgi:putative tricarboxylic transport membrane protein
MSGSNATAVVGWLLRATLCACALLTPCARAAPLYEQLLIIAPAAPGGGWDQTARAMQQVLQQAGIVRTPIVENIPGAAGTIGLARFIGAQQGKGDALMVSGLIMLGGIVTNKSPVTLNEVVPIARLTGEYEVLTVPAASPYRTLDDLISAFRARPESISWGGGSAGGSDQILAGLIAAAVGVAPRRVNYIAFSGGGESLSAILGGQVSVGINGLAEFAPHIAAGTVRVLAISSGQRLAGLDLPTLREQGVDIEFENWRSVVAPAGITQQERQQLQAAVGRMVHSAEWRAMLDRYRWIDRHLDGDAFARYTQEEERRVRGILRELGSGGDGAASLAQAGPYPLFVLGGLVVFGITSLLGLRRRDEPQARPDPGKWRALALIVAGMVSSLLLAERAGFVIASALLFWFVARAFDAGRPLRDACFAIVISTGAYLLFARVLQLSLPAGWLGGWL